MPARRRLSATPGGATPKVAAERVRVVKNGFVGSFAVVEVGADGVSWHRILATGLTKKGAEDAAALWRDPPAGAPG